MKTKNSQHLQLLADCILSGQVESHEIVSLCNEHRGLRALLKKRYTTHLTRLRSSAG